MRHAQPLGLVLVLTSALRAGEGGDPAAVRRLMKDESPSARAAAVRRLAGAEDPAAQGVLLEALEDRHPYVRRAAAGVVGGWLDPAARRRVAEAVARAKSETARREACRAYALWADEEGWSRLRLCVTDRSPGVRAEAARWLAEDPSPPTTQALRSLLQDPDPEPRAEAVDALAGRPGEPAPAPLLADPDPGVRMAALESSVAKGGETAVVAVLHGLEDAVWSVRLLAAELAGRIRSRRLLAPLADALADERERVVAAAGRSLTTLTGIPFDPVRERWQAWLQTDEGRRFDPALTTPSLPPSFGDDPGGRTVSSVKFLDLPIASRHVGFVLDVSGSMKEPVPSDSGSPGEGGASRWEVVKREMRAVLERLTDAEGNVWCFSDEVVGAFPGAVRLNSVRRAEVGHWLDARQPHGKTALFDGIAAALAEPSLDTIVVLSDGVPSAGSFFTKTDILSEVRRLNRRRRARIDVIAVGAEGIARRWRDVLETLTRETGGVCLRK